MRGRRVLLVALNFKWKQLLCDHRWVPVDSHLWWHLGWFWAFFSQAKIQISLWQLQFVRVGGVWLAVGLSCLNMVDRPMSRPWKIPFMSDGHPGRSSVCMSTCMVSLFFPLSPFPFHLNSNEMQNENKWKDSALKMDLSQQPAATSRLNSDPLLHPLVQAWWKSILFFIARNGGWEGWGEIYKKKYCEEGERNDGGKRKWESDVKEYPFVETWWKKIEKLVITTYIYELEKRVAKEKSYVSCFFVDEEYEKV